MKQDAERQDRKRKREESRRESGEDEPTSKFGNMQRNIELAIEKVDTAKNLSESKLRAMLVCVVEGVRGGRGSKEGVRGEEGVWMREREGGHPGG